MWHEFPGLDLDVWLKQGRWKHLNEMISQLPAACRLNEAIANDPEYAAQALRQEALDQDKPKEPWHPRLSEFKLDHVMLREIKGSIDSLKEAFIGMNGGKPQPHKPFPVPYTEIDRQRDAEDKQFVVDIAGLFGFGPEDLF